MMQERGRARRRRHEVLTLDATVANQVIRCKGDGGASPIASPHHPHDPASHLW